jgi:hypothetical protein
MNDYLARFSESPASFKKSVTFLLVAWVCHPIFIYSLFWAEDSVTGSDKAIMKMAVVSLCLCLLHLLIKKWARALVVVGNTFIILNDFFYFSVTPRNTISTMLCVTVVLCTIVGTYWLFVKDSRAYFTQVNPKMEPPEIPDSNAGSNRPR